ncbi:MAG: hypothetical protein AB1546_08310 [bacterium]
MAKPLSLQDLKNCLRRLHRLNEIIETLENALGDEKEIEKVSGYLARAGKEMAQLAESLGGTNEEFDVGSAVKNEKDRRSVEEVLEEIKTVGEGVTERYDRIIRTVEQNREDIKEKLKIIRSAKETFEHFLKLADDEDPKFFDVRG